MNRLMSFLQLIDSDGVIGDILSKFAQVCGTIGLKIKKSKKNSAVVLHISQQLKIKIIAQLMSLDIAS